jgi:methylenetetrahydrofolate reductase (NADPH)
MTFREKILSGRFAITGEMTPRKGASGEPILSTLSHLRGVVDAVNVTDNQRASVKASSLAVSKVLLDEGVEPIYQLTCRDRNRIGLQSDLLGAHMLGIRNVLALSGDHPTLGDNPLAKPVFDLDSTQLLEAIGGLNGGVDMAGNRLDGPCDFFAGAALSPLAQDTEVELLKAKRKLDAGARFFQTQVVYDVDAFKDFMSQMPKEARVLAGIVPLKSVKMAQFMNERIPGVTVPKDLMDELKESKDPLRRGIEQAAAIIREVKPHCSGVHVMALGSEQHVRGMLNLAGLV